MRSVLLSGFAILAVVAASSFSPASAQSTPMTYQVSGKQYIVICAGGHGKLGTKMGDAVVAYALP